MRRKNRSRARWETGSVLREERTLRVLDKGRLAYGPALELQEDLHRRRAAGETVDTLVLVEHDPVYTLGRNAVANNVTAAPEELAARGIEVVGTSRGGDVTYHGPGQLVGYPIVALREFGLSVSKYVWEIEQTLIEVLADFGIEGRRDAANRGVWAGGDKIAAIGVRISRGVSMHGFALNVLTRLEDYKGIVPCGLRGRGVTSMHLYVPGIGIEAVKPRVVDVFARRFGYHEQQHET